MLQPLLYTAWQSCKTWQPKSAVIYSVTGCNCSEKSSYRLAFVTRDGPGDYREQDLLSRRERLCLLQRIVRVRFSCSCMVHFFIELERCLWIRRDIQSASGQGLKYPGNWWSSCRIRDCSTPTLKMNLCPGWKILYHTTDNSSTKSDKKYKQFPRPETSMPRFYSPFYINVQARWPFRSYDLEFRVNHLHFVHGTHSPVENDWKKFVQ